MKKKIIIGVAVVIVVAGAVFLYSARELIWYKYMSGKLLGEYEAMVEEYQTDPYGGATPEETLALFVTALKAGDAKLASNYFVPEKRKEMKRDLEAGLKSGGVALLIGDMEKEKNKSCSTDETMCTFYTYDENDVAEFSFDLFKNEYNGKWLIRDL